MCSVKCIERKTNKSKLPEKDDADADIKKVSMERISINGEVVLSKIERIV